MKYFLKEQSYKLFHDFKFLLIYAIEKIEKLTGRVVRTGEIDQRVGRIRRRGRRRRRRNYIIEHRGRSLICRIVTIINRLIIISIAGGIQVDIVVE